MASLDPEAPPAPSAVTAFEEPAVRDRAPPVRVRRATPGDAGAVAALVGELELGYAAIDPGAFVVAETLGPGSEVVGIAELRRLGGVRLLSCVGVRPDLQGLGLGSRLVEETLAGVAEDVWLYTLVPEFFRGVGFEDAPAQPAGVPPRRIYGCEGCEPARCRRMVRRGRPDRTPAAGRLQADDLAALGALLPTPGDLPCDLLPANLWIWRDCEAPSVVRTPTGFQVDLAPHHEAVCTLEPPGASDAGAAVREALGRTGRVTRVRREFVDLLDGGAFDASPLRDRFDYVCDARAIAESRGTRNDGRRNRMRKFAREHPRHEVRALSACDGAAALALFERWAAAQATRDAAGALPGAECQRRAVERAFEDFAMLGLTGCAVDVDGRLAGFVAGSRAGDAVAAHLLYAEPGFDGLSPTLLVEACRGPFSDAPFVNLEEDLGLPGLRRTKLAWHPVRMIEKFEVSAHRRP